MSRGKGRGLEYDVAPDLVQPGAASHRVGAATPQEAPATPTPSRGRLAYDPVPFLGARAPAGPAPEAVAALKAQGMWEEPAEKTPNRVAPTAPNRVAPTASKRMEPVAVQPEPAAQVVKPPSRKTNSKPPRQNDRPRTPTETDGEARIARTIRLAPNVDAQIQAIAARFGVDLTAAVAIAVTHGYQALATAGFVK